MVLRVSSAGIRALGTAIACGFACDTGQTKWAVLELLNHQAMNPGTTSRSTRRKCLFCRARRRTHTFFGLVSRLVAPGSTGPSPEQKVYVYVPFSLPTKVDAMPTPERPKPERFVG